MPSGRARTRPVMTSRDHVSTYAPREILLAAAARAVLAAFRDQLEAQRLPGPATATLRVLETALEPYFLDLPAPRLPPEK